ncbi:MAG: hypothetical protein ACTSWN_15825 [Promethearchaeota archaeon]
MPRKKQQVRKKMSPREIKNFTSRKLDIVRILLESGKTREAMVYMFHILAFIIQDKFDFPRRPSMTVKEYLSNFMRNLEMPGDNIHPFVQLFEELIYSHHQFPPNVFNEYYNRWANLYRDISGDMPPNF